MQIQNQTQQITEEEFWLPLSEEELESIAGGIGVPPPMPKPPEPTIKWVTPDDSLYNCLVQPNREKTLNHLIKDPKALSSYYGWG